jgi:phage shock protein PspC (stress-responsive transcriptional regulator)
MERTPRVYRVPRGQGGVLFGLCAGIGEHLGVDPIVIRIAFALLFTVPVGGFSVAVWYVVFSLLTPVKASS